VAELEIFHVLTVAYSLHRRYGNCPVGGKNLANTRVQWRNCQNYERKVMGCDLKYIKKFLKSFLKIVYALTFFIAVSLAGGGFVCQSN